MSMLIDPYRFGVAPPATPSAFFASDPMLSTGWETVSGPSGFHHSGITYAAWQFVGLSGYKGVHVAAYNHGTGQWGERYTAGNFLLADDDHGHPAILRDADGYIHCFYGSHSSSQKYSVSNAADDITGWTQRPDFGSTLTYPKAVLVGSTIYLFARERAITTNLKLTLTTMTPTAGIGTWSSFQNIVDFGADSRVYQAEAHAVGTDIHFTCTRANASDTERKGVYYFIYDTTTGSVKNYNSTTTVTSGSLPVDLTTANASFRIYDHGSNTGDLPSLQFDTPGNAHVLFADGASSPYDLKHMMLSSGSWSSPTTIASIVDRSGSGGFVDAYCLVPGASGQMEAWYNGGDDMVRRVRSSGGTWASEETILAAGSYPQWRQAAIKDAHSNFRTLFAESSGSATDSSAVNLSLYAYGDSGPVNAAIDMSAVDPVGWSNVFMLLPFKHRNASTTAIDASKSSVRPTLFGDAQIDTSVTPFVGEAMLKLDGTADYATLPNNAAYSVAGTDDVSFDFWFRPNELGRLQVLLANRHSSGNSHEFQLNQTASNQLQLIMWNNSTIVLNITGSTAVTTGVTYKGQFVRASGVTYLLYGPAGGTVALEVSGTQSSAPTAGSQAFHIGKDPGFTTRNYNGWIGFPRGAHAAREIASFSAPTTPPPQR